MAKRYKHKKLPFPIKFKNNKLDMQFIKFAEEFEELATENANILNKTRRDEKINIEDIKKAAYEAFDISQAAQTYIYILGEIFGKHYSFDVENFFKQKLNINDERGYYRSDSNE